MDNFGPAWKRLEKRYFCAIGEASVMWNHVESSLCNTFCLCINPHNAFPTSSAFWAIVSFEGKLAMVHAVAQKATLHYPDLASEWTAIHNRTLLKSKKRNMIAHSSIISTFAPRKKGLETFLAPYYHQGRAKRFPPSRDAKLPMDGRPENRMYLEDVRQAKKNFYELLKRIDKFNDALARLLKEDR